MPRPPPPLHRPCGRAWARAALPCLSPRPARRAFEQPALSRPPRGGVCGRVSERTLCSAFVSICTRGSASCGPHGRRRAHRGVPAQVTSLFLHWYPACVAWTERWHPQARRASPRSGASKCRDFRGATGGIEARSLANGRLRPCVAAYWKPEDRVWARRARAGAGARVGAAHGGRDARVGGGVIDGPGAAAAAALPGLGARVLRQGARPPAARTPAHQLAQM